MTQPNDPSSTPPPPPPQGQPQPVNYSGPATASGAYTGPEPTPDAKQLSMITHILNWVLLVPLLVFLLKKDSHPFVEDQTKEALNFTLTCLIVHVLCGVTAFLCVPAIISIALFVTQIVLGIMGGLKARDGIAYRYPLNFRMIR